MGMISVAFRNQRIRINFFLDYRYDYFVSKSSPKSSILGIGIRFPRYGISDPSILHNTILVEYI